MGTLDGRVALVTGASRGIGAGIARRLAREGAAVTITYGSSSTAADEVVGEIVDAGGVATAVAAEAGDPSAVASAVQATVDTHGRLDILVNNVGTNVVTAIADARDDDFDRMIDVNVRSMFVATRAALDHLPDGGRIISVGSVFADLDPFPGMSLYAMTKAAVAGFTRGLARELGPRAITVNTVQPGAVDTDTNPADGGTVATIMRERTALGRYATPDEIAGLVAYLAGPDAAFVTGATYNVDGGFIV